MDWRIERHALLDSTNDEARRRALAGEPEGLVVLAEAQRAGRGRRGRVWSSPPGGLYLSVLTRPDIPPRESGRLALAAGWAVAETVAQLGLAPALRWPNDVMLGPRKLAGVLCETHVGGDATTWAILGIGLNRAEQPELAGIGGISLSEALGRPVGEGEVLEPLLDNVRGALAQSQGDAAALAAAWSRFSTMLGNQVTYITTEGAMHGRAVRVRTDGALEVEVGGRRFVVTDPALVKLREVT
ncbi:MAG: biotin--[acetyl-CoA-carboxylase] ligase [Halobacteriales archaeon]|nr:biotin--[acetyl-CoA-carboxylase] ligase [Halobacteriales archaeon]